MVRAITTALAGRIGTLCTPIDKGTCDVAGIPVQVREAFSHRRSEIVEYMDERGMTSRRAAEIATTPSSVARGAGNTFSIDAARDAWERSGIRVIATAPSARAAQELQIGASIHSTSADCLLAALAQGRQRPDAQTVVVIDEAGMLGTRCLAALLDYVEQANGKIVAIGDPKQLPEIDAGGLFAGVARRNGHIGLTENRRQLDLAEREALAALRAGHVADAVERMDRNGQLVCGPNADQVRNALAGDWFELCRAGSDAVMMTRRRQDTADLNERAHQLLVADGQLATAVMVVGGLEFAVGDRVVAHKNRYDLGILNAERANVLGLRDDRLLLDVDGGQRQLASPPTTSPMATSPTGTPPSSTRTRARLATQPSCWATTPCSPSSATRRSPADAT